MSFFIPDSQGNMVDFGGVGNGGVRQGGLGNDAFAQGGGGMQSMLGALPFLQGLMGGQGQRRPAPSPLQPMPLGTPWGGQIRLPPGVAR